jgi:uncharacterized RDD family membrane protein YckC
MKYAGFWLRFFAAIIDSIIITLISRILLMGFDAPAFSIDQTYFDALNSPITLMNTLIFWLYFSILESSPMQASLGKFILGLKVVDIYGRRIGFLRATGRHFGKIVSAFILMIGYLMAAFTDQKQALHDKMANCLVIKR